MIIIYKEGAIESQLSVCHDAPINSGALATQVLAKSQL